MDIIAIINQKGGCGKTTTAINLSASAAGAGKKVLLIDLDPQGHATLGLNVKEDKIKKSMYDVLSNLTAETLDSVIIPVTEKLDLAPSNILLSAVEQQLSGMTDRELRLSENIVGMKREYDYIIIDCPPNLGILTFNALVACNRVIIPIETSFFSLHGVMKLLETINLVKEEVNPGIRFKALVTMYDRRKKIDRKIMKDIKEYFKKDCFDVVIRANVKLKECAGFGCPITGYDKHSSGFEDYASLTNEMFSELQRDEVVFSETKSNQQSAISIKAEETEPEEEKKPEELDSKQTLQESKQEEIIVEQEDEKWRDEKFEDVVPEQVWNEVTFSFWAPDAKMVKLAGDFNNWSSEGSISLENRGEGLWEVKLPLKSGTYQYKYIVDGDWRIDPNNPLKTNNDFGGENSLLELTREN